MVLFSVPEVLDQRFPRDCVVMQGDRAQSTIRPCNGVWSVTPEKIHSTCGVRGASLE